MYPTSIRLKGEVGQARLRLEEVAAEEWMDKVHRPDILGKPEQIYKKPGYSSV
jgi:hypothetical protein